jgi:hypothetical protein
LSDNSYKVNLDGLAAGNYKFAVKELKFNSYSGRFEILDFDIEKQFVNLIMKLSNWQLKQAGKHLSNQVGSLIKIFGR